MKNNTYYVYLLTNKRRHNIYVGLTKNLGFSVSEQAFQVLPDLSSESLCTRLVYFELYRDSVRAEARKMQLTKASLCKKLALIDRTNPGWCRLERCAEIRLQVSTGN